jgi:hypothetical protein
VLPLQGWMGQQERRDREQEGYRFFVVPCTFAAGLATALGAGGGGAGAAGGGTDVVAAAGADAAGRARDAGARDEDAAARAAVVR